MVTQIPDEEMLESVIAELEAQPQTPDTEAAIAKIRNQIAHLSDWDDMRTEVDAPTPVVGGGE